MNTTHCQLWNRYCQMIILLYSIIDNNPDIKFICTENELLNGRDSATGYCCDTNKAIRTFCIQMRLIVELRNWKLFLGWQKWNVLPALDQIILTYLVFLWITVDWESLTHNRSHHIFVIIIWNQNGGIFYYICGKDNGLLTCEQHLYVWESGGNHLTHWGRDKMEAISQTTFSNAFSWMKMFEYWLKFHWNLFLRVQLIIFQHWFR